MSLMRRPERGTVLSLVALFAALAGTSYAAIQVPVNSVGAKQLKKRAVTTTKVKPSARKALKGRKGARGAVGPVGATGAKGPAGGPGPKPIALHMFGTTNPSTSAPLYAQQGLSVVVTCDNTNGGRMTIAFGALGTGATANVTWTVQSGGPGGAGPVETYQDGAANGAVQVVREHHYSSRLNGRAVLRREGLVATVLFQALVTGFNGCGLTGTVTPAT